MQIFHVGEWLLGLSSLLVYLLSHKQNRKPSNQVLPSFLPLLQISSSKGLIVIHLLRAILKIKSGVNLQSIFLPQTVPLSRPLAETRSRGGGDSSATVLAFDLVLFLLWEVGGVHCVFDLARGSAIRLAADVMRHSKSFLRLESIIHLL